jgi:peptidoglycan-associated lipoprotein
MRKFFGRLGGIAVSVGWVVLVTGCAEHELAVSVQERGSVTPKATAALPAPTPPPAPATKPAPPEPPILPLVEERVATEPLPLPTPPRTEPVTVAKPASPPPVNGVPFLLDIPFNFDHASLREDAKAMLEVNASRLQESEGWRLLLEGHCDEVGTSEYNLVLGERRVQTVKQYLVNLGLSSSAIEGVSYGKERPLCAEHTSECWQKNRTVHFEPQ